MLLDISFNDGISIKFEEENVFASQFVVVFQCEKYLDNDSYPYLLPKSYDDDQDLTVKNWKDFLEHPPYKVDAQVNLHFLFDHFFNKFNISSFASVFDLQDLGLWEQGLLNHRFKMRIYK